MQDKGGQEIVERMQMGKSSPAAKRLLDTYLLQWFSDHGRRYVDKQGAAATHATSKSNHGVVAFQAAIAVYSRDSPKAQANSRATEYQATTVNNSDLPGWE